jgi:hypothetical protein
MDAEVRDEPSSILSRDLPLARRHPRFRARHGGGLFEEVGHELEGHRQGPRLLGRGHHPPRTRQGPRDRGDLPAGLRPLPGTCSPGASNGSSASPAPTLGSAASTRRPTRPSSSSTSIVSGRKAAGSRISCRCCPGSPGTWYQVQGLLRDLKREGKAHPRGQTRAARWFPGAISPIQPDPEGDRRNPAQS